jgi:hemoglobin-like flavoprotein
VTADGVPLIYVVVEAIVSDLDHPWLVRSYNQALARQCRRHGVRSQHYMTAGVALLGALRENLGDEFTPELEAAWARVYAAVANALQELTTLS